MTVTVSQWLTQSQSHSDLTCRHSDRTPSRTMNDSVAECVRKETSRMDYATMYSREDENNMLNSLAHSFSVLRERRRRFFGQRRWLWSITNDIPELLVQHVCIAWRLLVEFCNSSYYWLLYWGWPLDSNIKGEVSPTISPSCYIGISTLCKQCLLQGFSRTKYTLSTPDHYLYQTCDLLIIQPPAPGERRFS